MVEKVPCVDVDLPDDAIDHELVDQLNRGITRVGRTTSK